MIITKKATLVVGNPYIQHGLIAMYDGIWNAGLGKHDPDAAMWHDLTGNGYDAKRYGNPMWSDDCAVLHGGKDSFRTGSLLGMPANLTLEVVYHVNDISGNYVPFGCMDSGGFGIWMNSTAAFYHCHHFAYPLKIEGDIDSIGTKVSRVIATQTGEGMRVYRNAELIASTLRGGPTYYNRNCGFNIGADSNGTQFGIECPLIGAIYTVRVYNRALSASEISHNHVIDRSRFKL